MEPAPTTSHVPPADFLAPPDLELTPVRPARVLALGSCFLEDLLTSRNVGADPNTYDLLIVNGLGAFEHSIPGDAGVYDYQLVQLGLRFIVPDQVFAPLNYDDIAGFETALADCRERLRERLDHRMRLNREHGLLTFVFNFLTPQFNPMGRLFPRFDVRNIEYFVMLLNQELERLAGAYRNCFVVDMDRLAASFGRRFIQDDSFTSFNHNARLPPGHKLNGRIEALGPLGDYYDCPPAREFSDSVMAEIRAMRRTVLAADTVKLVVVDLDDTLWNGVSGDLDDAGPEMAEGWPRGVLEALLYLKQRGVLLAIASKNDEARIRAIWPAIFTKALSMDIFAAVRINWRPKAENMAEILQAMNLLPRSVVFVDDNPAERAAMQEAFPDMRIIGRNPYYLRRILLLAPETQVTGVTGESARRTVMMQAQLQRETARSTVAPEDFLREQQVNVKLNRILSADHKRFARALELINKTNQFNTTGQRWTVEQCTAHFAAGGFFVIYTVEDRHTNYGLVGVVIVRGAHILQWVMSCRVIGLGVEQTAMHALIAAIRRGGDAAVRADLVKTPVNLPCQALYRMAGFTEQNGAWILPAEAGVPEKPNFVTLETGAALAA